VSGFAFGIALLADAAAIIPAAIAGIYVGVVTFEMIQASVAFVQHFGFMLDALQTQQRDGAWTTFSWLPMSSPSRKIMVSTHGWRAICSH
jgi:hypothetical protein